MSYPKNIYPLNNNKKGKLTPKKNINNILLTIYILFKKTIKIIQKICIFIPLKTFLYKLYIF